MRSLFIRIFNIACIVAVLATYNSVTAQRVQADQEAKAAADAENDRIRAANAALHAQMAAEAARIYEDGIFEAEAAGYGGMIRVSVEIEDDEILDIQILSAEKEDLAYMEMAKGIIPKMISDQTADIDTVSGSTFSSAGIKNAVAKALEEAKK